MPGRTASGPGSAAHTGVLGGSFDPPHVGHAIVAQDLVERLALDRLLVVPAADPPHRDVVLPAPARLELVRALFAGVPHIEVSDIEHERSGPSYSVDTLEALRERSPGESLTLVIGSDQLAVIDTWKEYERLPELARIAVMRRGSTEPAPPPGVTGIDYIVVDVTRIDVSASRIRQRLREGRSIRFLVPEHIRTHTERAWAEHAGRARNPAST